MCELHLEALLAAHPEAFFPGMGLRLIAEQRYLGPGSRFDLLFQDQWDYYWIVEVKAVPLRQADVAQVLRYWEGLIPMLRTKKVMPCFVAPRVAPRLRATLNEEGVEAIEVPLPRFREVLERSEEVLHCSFFGGPGRGHNAAPLDGRMVAEVVDLPMVPLAGAGIILRELRPGDLVSVRLPGNVVREAAVSPWFLHHAGQLSLGDKVLVDFRRTENRGLLRALPE